MKKLLTVVTLALACACGPAEENGVVAARTEALTLADTVAATKALLTRVKTVVGRSGSQSLDALTAARMVAAGHVSSPNTLASEPPPVVPDITCGNTTCYCDGFISCEILRYYCAGKYSCPGLGAPYCQCGP